MFLIFSHSFRHPIYCIQLPAETRKQCSSNNQQLYILTCKPIIFSQIFTPKVGVGLYAGYAFGQNYEQSKYVQYNVDLSAY